MIYNTKKNTMTSTYRASAMKRGRLLKEICTAMKIALITDEPIGEVAMKRYVERVDAEFVLEKRLDELAKEC